MSTTKLTARPLERLAVIYVRQSTPGQVLGIRESTARQYGLVERAVELGWARASIQTINSDLGQSAGQPAQGTLGGFGELCRLLALGQVGGVFGVEVLRLARNTVEWFQLLDLCWMHKVAIIIEDGQVYLPSRDDDGLILGIICTARHKMPNKLGSAVPPPLRLRHDLIPHRAFGKEPLDCQV